MLENRVLQCKGSSFHCNVKGQATGPTPSHNPTPTFVTCITNKESSDAHSRQGWTPFGGVVFWPEGNYWDQYWRNGLSRTLCNVEGFPSIEGLRTAWFTCSEFCLSAFTRIYPLQINVVFSFLTNVLATAYPASSWFPASLSWSVITINPAIHFLLLSHHNRHLCLVMSWRNEYIDTGNQAKLEQLAADAA